MLPESRLASKRTQATYVAMLSKYPSDHPFWHPRNCFRAPTEAAWEVARNLSAAVDALLAGDFEKAARDIQAAETPEILEWGIPVMSTVNPEIVRWRPIDETKLPEQVHFGRHKPSAEMERAMYKRDGWRCRFCGVPIVAPEARKRICALLPGTVRWMNAHGDHAGFEILSGVADHVQPHSWSGLTDLDNLVTCCAPCNYGRGPAFLEEMGLIDPRTRDPYPANGWDGVTRVLSINAPPRTSTSAPAPNMAAWSGFSHLVRRGVTSDD